MQIRFLEAHMEVSIYRPVLTRANCMTCSRATIETAPSDLGQLAPSLLSSSAVRILAELGRLIGDGVDAGTEVVPFEDGGEHSQPGGRRLVLRAGREDSLLYVVLASPSVVFTSMGKWLGLTMLDL